MKNLSFLIAAILTLCAFNTSAQQVAGHDYVDLGLSSGTLWATCNVGADKASDYGKCFAWGTVTPEKPTENYQNPAINNYSGNAKYDAATAAWGAEWGTPTTTQAQELLSKCKWVWTRLDGIRGYKVTGPNGNSIFFPASGVGMTYFGDNGLTFTLSWTGHAGSYWTANNRKELYLGEVLNEMDDSWERPIHMIYEYSNEDWLRFVRPVVIKK